MSGGGALEERDDRAFYVFAAAVSVVALAIIAWVLLLRGGEADASVDLRFMPAVNAGLNTLAASLLVAGWLAVRRGRRRLHRTLMISAFAASCLFLVGYLAYHWVHGDTRYPGEGWDRVVYLVVLATHVLLSMAVVPMALTSFYFALRGRLDRHRRVARLTLPVWLYVSVTGVVIFVMLRASTGM